MIDGVIVGDTFLEKSSGGKKLVGFVTTGESGAYRVLRIDEGKEIAFGGKAVSAENIKVKFNAKGFCHKSNLLANPQ